MKTFIKLPLMALLAILIFNGCRKDPASKSTNQLPVKTITTTEVIPDVMVMTPHGLMPKSQVHLVETGYHLELRNDHVMKIKDANGEFKEDFGAIITSNPLQTTLKNQVSNQTVSSSALQKNLSTQPNSGGWKTYSEWNAGTNVPIGSFSSTWIVPTLPSTTGALIYIGNGVESGQYSASASNLSIEATLQFGTNGAFGSTTSWMISNWCSWNGGAAYSTPVSVSAGASLTGNIVLTNQNGSTYNYTCSFANQSNSLNVTQGNTSNASGTAIPQITVQSWAFESLQSYTFNTNSNYPTPAASVNMTAVALQTGLPGSQTYPAISWTAITAAAASNGEHTVIVSNTNTSASHGEVDLYYRYAAPSISYPASSYTLSTCGAITPITPTNTGGGGVTYTVSPALPAGLSISSSTGVISGTPTTASSAANYTVTATNSGGTSSKTLSITVTSPGSFTYPSEVFHQGVAISPVSPTVTGTAPTHYTVSPALPAGLGLNASTGVISGTPTTSVPASNFIVTGTNGSCSSNATISIEVDFQFTFANNISLGSNTNPWGSISVTCRYINSDGSYGAQFVADVVNAGVTKTYWLPSGNYHVVMNPGSGTYPPSVFFYFTGPSASGQSSSGAPGAVFSSVPFSPTTTTGIACHN